MGWSISPGTGGQFKPNWGGQFHRIFHKDELDHLIAHVYNENTIDYKLLTFTLFWPGNENVSISNDRTKELETKFCDDANEHDLIVSSLKKIFLHNPKHDKFKSGKSEYHGNVVSPLRCYDERLKDSTLIQSILDTSVYIDNDYYGYDATNKAYIRFECTEKNIYHGFEIEPFDDLKPKLDKAFDND